MSVLIKQAQIICQGSALNGQIKDIFIENGIIQSIGNDIITDSTYVVKEDKVCVSIGWMDIFAQFSDPGFEYRETIESGAAAAAAGGFTDVLVMPNTNPVVHNKSFKRQRLCPSPFIRQRQLQKTTKEKNWQKCTI
jgi:dihydroorotase